MLISDEDEGGLWVVDPLVTVAPYQQPLFKQLVCETFVLDALERVGRKKGLERIVLDDVRQCCYFMHYGCIGLISLPPHFFVSRSLNRLDS